MGTRRTKFVILAVFTLAILGGGTAGILAGRYVAPASTSVSGTLPLSEALQLSPDQRDQIRVIWEAMRDEADDCYRQAEWLNQERENDLMKILTDEQKLAYQKIHHDYVDRYTALDAKRQLAFNHAVEHTKLLLSPSQRQRYETILAGRLGHGTSEHSGFGLDRSPRTASSLPSMPSETKPLPSPG
jgi:hypothetical protein